jgi:hypothetical protein
MLPTLAAIASFALSFAGLGVMWIGKPWGEIVIALLYLALAFGVARWRGRDSALFSVGLPMLPLGLLIMQFRDNSDSHLLGIAITAGWALGILIGACWGARFASPARMPGRPVTSGNPPNDPGAT